MPIEVLKAVDDMIAAIPSNALLKEKITELRARILALEDENVDLRRQLSLTPLTGALHPSSVIILEVLFSKPAGLDSSRLAAITGLTEKVSSPLLDDLRKRGMVFCISGVFTIRQSGRDFIAKRSGA